MPKSAKSNSPSASETSPVTIRFDDLSESVYSNSCSIIGCIVNCYPIQPSKAFGKFRKLLLRDLMLNGTLGDRVLPCFLYGKFVDQTRELKRGDTLTVSGFEVKPYVHYENDSAMYPYQVDVITTANVEPTAILSEKKTVSFDCLEMISKPYGGVCIVGQVINSFANKKTDSRETSKKLTLKDESPNVNLGNLLMDCILYDKIADHNRVLKAGDIIRLTGFCVEARPSTSATQNFYQYQVVLDSKNEKEFDQKPSVFVLKSAEKNVCSVPAPSKSAAYQYSLLKELEEEFKKGSGGKKHFHVYGVVGHCVILNSSLNECLKIIIRDPTLDSFTVFVRIRPDACEIPDISPNDVVRFHRMYLEEYRKGCQGICYSVKDLLVFPSKNAVIKPVHTSRTYTWTEDDEKTMSILRSWVQSSCSVNGMQNGNVANSGWINPRKDKNIQLNGNYKNCVNALPRTTPPKRESKVTKSPQFVSSVATQTPPKLAQKRSAKNVQSNSLDKEGSTKRLTSPLKKPQVTEATLPARGIESQVNTARRSPRKIQDLSKLSSDAETPDIIPPTPVNNLTSNILQGTKRQLNFDEETPSKRKNLNCPSLSSSVADGQAELIEDVRTRWTTDEAYPLTTELLLPNVVSAPTNGHNQPVIPICELKDSSLFSHSRVRAKVVDIYPPPSEAHNSVFQECPHCHFHVPERMTKSMIFFRIGARRCYLCPKCEASQKRGKILKPSFVFCLRLHDGSGAVNAYLYGRQAEYFLGNLKPTGLNHLERVREVMTRILSVATSRDSPPILDCYLFKYEMNDGHGFQIVDTKLL